MRSFQKNFYVFVTNKGKEFLKNLENEGFAFLRYDEDLNELRNILSVEDFQYNIKIRIKKFLEPYSTEIIKLVKGNIFIIKREIMHRI